MGRNAATARQARVNYEPQVIAHIRMGEGIVSSAPLPDNTSFLMANFSIIPSKTSSKHRQQSQSFASESKSYLMFIF